MRRLVLTEHQTTRGIRLTAAEREALLTVVPEVAITPSRGVEAGPGRFDVAPGSWVGVAQVAPSLVVEIAPKLPVSRVLFLVSHAMDPRSWRLGETISLETQADLIETIVGLFCVEVGRALRFGLLQGYRCREDALNTVRGRLRSEEQLRRRLGQMLPAECAYDDVTPDILENQILRAALRRVARLPLAISRRAHALLPAFAAVADHDFPTGAPEITETRLNAHLRPALELARLILSGGGLEARLGSAGARSLLFDMDRIFEDFVVASLRRALGLPEWAFPQGGRGRKRLILDRAGALALEPDLAWWEGRRCLFVGDVKYKRTAHGEQADLYQLLAYATAANLPGGLLIYASGEQDARVEHVHDVPHGAKALHIAALDLAASPEDVLAQVAQIGRTVRRLKAASVHSAA